MTLGKAVVRNVGTCRFDVKRGIQVEVPQEKSIDAGHRGGVVRSSEETSVMEAERRDHFVQLYEVKQPEMGGFD